MKQATLENILLHYTIRFQYNSITQLWIVFPKEDIWVYGINEIMSLLTISFSDGTQKGAMKQVVCHNYRWAIILIQYPASLSQGPGFPLAASKSMNEREIHYLSGWKPVMNKAFGVGHRWSQERHHEQQHNHSRVHHGSGDCIAKCPSFLSNQPSVTVRRTTQRVNECQDRVLIPKTQVVPLCIDQGPTKD